MSKISRRDFLKVTGIAAAAAALTACGGSSSTASSAAASSEVVKKLDKISVAVPNDTTNEARALALLEKNGFFKVKADAGLTATKNDIEENPFNVNIDEVEAAQVPSVLQDEDYAVINSNYAISAGLNPVEDALAIEDGSSAYVNVLVCKDGNQESPKIKALAAALESQQVKDFIDEKYAGSVVFVVENPTDGYDSTVDYDALNGETVSCAATPAPHCEILEICKDILAQKGITLDVQEFDDYIQPNNVVEDGQIDTNYFQHQPYLDDFNQEHGTHLVTVAGIHVEPMGIYAGKSDSLDNLPDGASVAVPNDATNEGRALLLLEAQGLIKLADDSNLSSTPKDIVENPKNLTFTEVEAATIPSIASEVDLAVINSNYALGAGLNPVEDALALESSDSPYVNVLVCKEGNENNAAIQALAEALHSDAVKNYIAENFDGAVIAVD